MMEFRTFEDVLDIAILQEKASQQFYSDLSRRVQDEHVRSFYHELVEQERLHEQKLLDLKRYEYDLKEPDLDMLRNTGYLDAIPITPGASMDEAVRYAIKKERSAKLLYQTLAKIVSREELATLFRTLADQEQAHAEFFETEYIESLTNPSN